MSDAIVSSPVVWTEKGRVPSVDSLERRIYRINKLISRANKLQGLLPELHRKLAIVSDPAFVPPAEMTVEKKADKAEKLLASLPADVIAAIMAKLAK